MAKAAIRAADETPRAELRAIDAPQRKKRFAAIDHEIARVLGPNRGAAALYGYLASAWFEFASPEAIKDIEAKTKRPKTPGDWVDITYQELMAFLGTRAKASIIRWIRVLAEEQHACPWGHCSDEHPLIVTKRVGQNRPNRYRRWKCGEDSLSIKPRIKSRRLAELAQARVRDGRMPNGQDLTARPPDLFRKSENETSERASAATEVPQRDFHAVPPEVSPHDIRSTHDETFGSSDTERPKPTPQDFRESHGETSLHVNSLQISTARKDDASAAASEMADDVDAVACEVVDAILALAQRTEPSYRDEQAWAVARRLAPLAITQARGSSAGARALLLSAIADRRLARAANPVGLLIRGITGDRNGDDRFLLQATPAAAPVPKPAATVSRAKGTEIAPGLKAALLDALRAGRTITVEWLRERDIPASELVAARKIIEAETADAVSPTPLCDQLESDYPTSFSERLDQVARGMKPPVTIELVRSHPMIGRMCRANLEAVLRSEFDPNEPNVTTQNI